MFTITAAREVVLPYFPSDGDLDDPGNYVFDSESRLCSCCDETPV
jgi:hypothetical protein